MIPTVAGLYRRISGQWEVIDQSRGMAVNATFAITEDREGAYWIGLGGRAFSDGSAGKPGPVGHRPRVLSPATSLVRIGSSTSTFCAGPNNGVAMWDPQAARWRIWKSKDGLNGSLAREMILAPDGAVWVLCFPGGLTRFDPESLTPRENPDSRFCSNRHSRRPGRPHLDRQQSIPQSDPYVAAALSIRGRAIASRKSTKALAALLPAATASFGPSAGAAFPGSTESIGSISRLPTVCCRAKSWKPLPSVVTKFGFAMPMLWV